MAQPLLHNAPALWPLRLLTPGHGLFLHAGAAQSLGAGAILVNPWNITDMAQVCCRRRRRRWQSFAATMYITNEGLNAGLTPWIQTLS